MSAFARLPSTSTRNCKELTSSVSAAADLELDEYKAIRSSPNLFVIVPGHETRKVDLVVEANDRYALVKKIRKLGLVTDSHQPITERRG
jgi:hypothetical protein